MEIVAVVGVSVLMCVAFAAEGVTGLPLGQRSDFQTPSKFPSTTSWMKRSIIMATITSTSGPMNTTRSDEINQPDKITSITLFSIVAFVLVICIAVLLFAVICPRRSIQQLRRYWYCECCYGNNEDYSTASWSDTTLTSVVTASSNVTTNSNIFRNLDLTKDWVAPTEKRTAQNSGRDELESNSTSRIKIIPLGIADKQIGNEKDNNHRDHYVNMHSNYMNIKGTQRKYMNIVDIHSENSECQGTESVKTHNSGREVQKFSPKSQRRRYSGSALSPSQPYPHLQRRRTMPHCRRMTSFSKESPRLQHSAYPQLGYYVQKKRKSCPDVLYATSDNRTPEYDVTRNIQCWLDQYERGRDPQSPRKGDEICKFTNTGCVDHRLKQKTYSQSDVLVSHENLARTEQLSQQSLQNSCLSPLAPNCSDASSNTVVDELAWTTQLPIKDVSTAATILDKMLFAPYIKDYLPCSRHLKSSLAKCQRDPGPQQWNLDHGSSTSYLAQYLTWPQGPQVPHTAL